ncbi:apolipoprotein D-like [Cherax quadricarinatus]|uniref:apolipoprotein D-like n=1 Tax=Cherax quadricarinatus TaxID=27406 RepID=UPI00387E2531
MMRLLTVVVVVLAGPLHLVTAHKMELGLCKSMPEVENFDPDKFAGEWYVLESVLTSSSCVRLVFNRTQEGFTMQHFRELFIAQVVGFNHVFRTTGILRLIKGTARMIMIMIYIASREVVKICLVSKGVTKRLEELQNLGESEVMRLFAEELDSFCTEAYLEFNADPRLFTTYLTVVDTDYTQYAVLYECTTMMFVRRYTVRILSRQPTLDAALLRQVCPYFVCYY